MPSASHEKRWLSIIGLGEDGLEGIAPAARAALEAARFVYGGKRHLALAKPAIRGETRSWPTPIESAFPEIAALRGEAVAVLASGDPFHYGVGSLIAAYVSAAEMRVFPKPSSLSLAAARVGWALQDCTIVSLHGRPLQTIIPALAPGARILALAWDGTTAGKLATLFIDRGHEDAVLHLLEALDGPRERIHTVSLRAARGIETDPLTVIAVEMGQGAGMSLPLTPGLDDERFEHDGQLTKQDIRAMTLARLAPQPGQLLWDIGGGSGSIGIEWMLRHPSCRAIAVERSAERVARIKRNALALGVPLLKVVEGSAPAALSGLPVPDAVFIGGGVSDDAILRSAFAALKDGGRIVANAVTVEGEQALLAARQRDGGEIRRIAIDSLDSVGPYRAFRPAMTITQWSHRKGTL